jgi:hypothetical protein
MSSIKYLPWLSRRVEFPPGKSGVLEQIRTKFRRLPICFRVKLLNVANADIVGYTVHPEIQDDGSKTEVPISRAVFGKKKISKAIIILSGNTNVRKCRATLDASLTNDDSLSPTWRPTNWK